MSSYFELYDWVFYHRWEYVFFNTQILSEKVFFVDRPTLVLNSFTFTHCCYDRK